MINLPANLILEKNKLDGQAPWLVTLDIVMPNSDQYFLVRNNEDITFNTQLYTAVPFELDIYTQDGTGEIPSINLTISNVHRVFQSYLEAYDGALAATVKVRVINMDNLTESYTELELDFDIMSSSATSESIVFVLGAPNPLRRRFPLHRFIAMHCNWQFLSVECAYGGADLTCDRTFTACTAKSNTPRFGGYPGLNRIGVRLV